MFPLISRDGAVGNGSQALICNMNDVNNLSLLCNIILQCISKLAALCFKAGTHFVVNLRERCEI